MPHKTRQEKIIADLRKKINLQKKLTNLQKETPGRDANKVTPVENIISYKPAFSQKGPVENKNTTTSMILTDYTYIISDFKKTLFLTGIILLIEFLLYWLLELKGIKIF